MSDLIKSHQPDFIDVIHSKKSLDLPKPFSREIFLFHTHVAGTGYVDNIKELEPELTSDIKLNFFREPQNEFDPQAIMIKTESGNEIGYIPKSDNIIFSRLMDAGKLLFGRITSVKKHEDWLKIEIDVLLQE